MLAQLFSYRTACSKGAQEIPSGAAMCDVDSQDHRPEGLEASSPKSSKENLDPHELARGWQRRKQVYRQLEILQLWDREKTEARWREHREVCRELLEALQRKLSLEEGATESSSSSCDSVDGGVKLIATVEAAATVALEGDSKMASVNAKLPHEAVLEAVDASRSLVRAARVECLYSRSRMRRFSRWICRACMACGRFAFSVLIILLFVDHPASAAARVLPAWLSPTFLAALHAVVRGLVASAFHQRFCGESLTLLPLPKCGGGAAGCAFPQGCPRQQSLHARLFRGFFVSVIVSVFVEAAVTAAAGGEAWCLSDALLAPVVLMEFLLRSVGLSALTPLGGGYCLTRLQLLFDQQGELGWLRVPSRSEEEAYFLLFLSAVAVAGAASVSGCKKPPLLWDVHARLEHAVARGTAAELESERRTQLAASGDWKMRLPKQVQWLRWWGRVQLTKGVKCLCKKIAVLFFFVPLLLAWWGVLLIAVSEVPLLERNDSYLTLREVGEEMLQSAEVQEVVKELEELNDEVWKVHAEKGGMAALEWLGESIFEMFQKFKEEADSEQKAQDAAWRIFELDPGASASDIRARYKQLARQFHPDRISGASMQDGGNAPSKDAVATTEAERQMQKINLAYETLLKANGGRGAALRER